MRPVSATPKLRLGDAEVNRIGLKDEPPQEYTRERRLREGGRRRRCEPHRHRPRLHRRRKRRNDRCRSRQPPQASRADDYLHQSPPRRGQKRAGCDPLPQALPGSPPLPSAGGDAAGRLTFIEASAQQSTASCCVREWRSDTFGGALAPAVQGELAWPQGALGHAFSVLQRKT